MFLRNTEGEYEPSFFIIRLKTDQDIDVCASENEATFTHEYIHFLQDLTLPYCIRENLMHLAAFFDQMDATHSAGEIRLPKTAPIPGEELAALQSKMTWGSNSFIQSVAALESIEKSTEYVPEHGFNLYRYDLRIKDGSSYHFGARDLLEYIAYKIESKHFEGEEKLPDLPYCSVDLLVKHYGLSLLSDVKKIALAEHCLHNDNPAHRMIVLLQDFAGAESENFTKMSDEEFISFLQGANWKAVGVPFETIGNKLHRRLNELRQFLQARYPIEAFPDIFSWLDNVMEYASTALAGKSIFAELYKSETPEFQVAISRIINTVGVPLIVNNRGDLGTSLGGDDSCDQFIQLLLAYEFTGYINRSDPQCPLCSVCERDRPEIMNQDCLDGPFRRALDEDLCPFGVFTKAHGLSEVRWFANDKLIASHGSVW
jgi:hypothetical protein